MSKATKIYPMAFVPNPDAECRLYYVGFPKKWKDSLIRAEKAANPKWSGVYALPTYALGKSLGTWMDGIVELAPLRLDSKDEMWAISCEQEINTEQLLEHMKAWIQVQYKSGNSIVSDPVSPSHYYYDSGYNIEKASKTVTHSNITYAKGIFRARCGNGSTQERSATAVR